MENTLTTTPVNASAKTNQHVTIHTITMMIHVTVPANLTVAIKVSISITTVAAVSARNTKPAHLTNTSTEQLASVSVMK